MQQLLFLLRNSRIALIFRNIYGYVSWISSWPSHMLNGIAITDTVQDFFCTVYSFSYTKRIKSYKIIFILRVIVGKLYQASVYIYNYEKRTSKASYPDERRRIVCISAGKID